MISKRHHASVDINMQAGIDSHISQVSMFALLVSYDQPFGFTALQACSISKRCHVAHITYSAI